MKHIKKAKKTAKGDSVNLYFFVKKVLLKSTGRMSNRASFFDMLKYETPYKQCLLCIRLQVSL